MELRQYDYTNDWQRYTYEEEPVRFLSHSKEDLSKICDCIDLNNPERVFAGVPVHYDGDHLWVLKEGHTRVLAETGQKKTRTAAVGAIVSAVKNHDSFVVVDPKGELYHNYKIQNLLKDDDYQEHVVDMRTYDKDGVNLLAHALELYEQGRHSEAHEFVESFVQMLVGNKKTVDDYWNDTAADLLKQIANLLMEVLPQYHNGEKAFNVASIMNFLRMDSEVLKNLMAPVMAEVDSYTTVHPLQKYFDILCLPSKTYSCVMSSAMTLLAPFCGSEDMIKMFSTQTFDIRDAYKKPMAVFLIIPDEVDSANQVVSYMLDHFYSVLMEEYYDRYQNRAMAPCSIHFICDEAANVIINDMGSKVSAARSRQVSWLLIYQSNKQLENAYGKELPAITGNCRHLIFLGSSDYDELLTVSQSTGTTLITTMISAPLVSVNALRAMRIEKSYKEALIISGPYLYCAKMPDYDVYTFLDDHVIELPRRNCLKHYSYTCYSPEAFSQDFKDGIITYLEQQAGDSKKDTDQIIKDDEYYRRLEEEQKRLEAIMKDLFGDFDSDDKK